MDPNLSKDISPVMAVLSVTDQKRRKSGFKFLDLPPELRYMIYRYNIGYHKICWKIVIGEDTIRMMVVSSYSQANRPKRPPIGLIGTCKLVSEEVISVLYDQTEFHMVTAYPQPLGPGPDYANLPLSKFRFLDIEEYIPSLMLRRVRHVKLHIFSGFMDTSYTKARTRFVALMKAMGHGRRLKTCLLNGWIIDNLMRSSASRSRKKAWKLREPMSMLKSVELDGDFMVEFPRSPSMSIEQIRGMVNRIRKMMIDNGIQNVRIFIGDDYMKYRKKVS